MTSSIRSNDAFEHSLLAGWVESAGIGLCVLDAAGTVIVLNRVACAFAQIDPSTVINRPVRVLFRTILNAAPAEAWALDQTVESDFLMEALADGHRQFVQLKKSLVLDQHQERYQVICFSDVTGLLAAHRKLEQQTVLEVQRRQWQAINAGVVISDALQPDMPIIYVNPAFEQMSGYAAHEIMGKNCRFLQGDDDRQAGLQAIRDAIKNCTSGYAVLRNYRRDGSRFINELFISPVRNLSGEVVQFIGIQHLRNEEYL